MSGKSLARLATSAFIDTRHGSPRLHCENPMTCLAVFSRPQPAAARTTIAARTSLAAFALQPDRAEDDDALENELEIRIHIVQPHDVVDDSDRQHADERAADRSDSARETRASDDHCGDRIELVGDAV